MRPVVLPLAAGALAKAFGHQASWRSALLGLLVAAGGVTACAWAAHLWLTQSATLAGSLAALDREAAQLDRPATLPAPATPPHAPQQVRARNAVTAQLNTPWPRVLDALEQQPTPGVAIILVEPDLKKRLVRVQTEAKEVATALDHANRLGRDDLFSGMRLVRHQTNDQDPNRPARLEFELVLASRAPQKGSTP